MKTIPLCLCAFALVFGCPEPGTAKDSVIIRRAEVRGNRVTFDAFIQTQRQDDPKASAFLHVLMEEGEQLVLRIFERHMNGGWGELQFWVQTDDPGNPRKPFKFRTAEDLQAQMRGRSEQLSGVPINQPMKSSRSGQNIALQRQPLAYRFEIWLDGTLLGSRDSQILRPRNRQPIPSDWYQVGKHATLINCLLLDEE